MTRWPAYTPRPIGIARSLRSTLFFALAATTAGTGHLLAQTTGSIQGRVTDATSGSPLGGILVRAIRNSAPAVTQVATAAADGTFQISGLPEGAYQLCTTVTAGGYVDPCLWEQSGPVFMLFAGQHLTQASVPVKRGAVFQFRINDPAQADQSTAGAAAGARVHMGVMASGGRFYPVIKASSDALGSTHRITVPFDRPVPFTAVPIGLQATDSAGKAIAASGLKLVLSSSSTAAAPAVITFNVTGKH